LLNFRLLVKSRNCSLTRNVTQLHREIFRFFSSIQLAVITLTGLAVSMAAATLLESAYDTKTGLFWVYRSFWFYGLLILLGINIFAVAMSRYPWKKHHGPFLMAHIGILLLL